MNKLGTRCTRFRGKKDTAIICTCRWFVNPLGVRGIYIYLHVITCNYFLSPRQAYISARIMASMLLPPLLTLVLTLVSFSCVVGARHIPLDLAIAASVRFATKV